MSSSQDPFYLFKDELQDAVNSIDQRFQDWKGLLNGSNTAANGNFKTITADLNRDLKSGEEKLDFIEKTVRQVESKREQFSHIDETELSARRNFVGDTRSKLNSIRETLDSPTTREKLAKDDAEARKSRMANAKASGKNPYKAENAHFIQDEQQTQQMIMRKQDENLDRLGEGVNRVNDMAANFNVEIQDQNRMLDEMDDDLDKVTEKMNTVMGALSKLLKTKDKCQLWGVIVLFIILIILVGLVIYT